MESDAFCFVIVSILKFFKFIHQILWGKNGRHEPSQSHPIHIHPHGVRSLNCVKVNPFTIDIHFHFTVHLFSKQERFN